MKTRSFGLAALSLVGSAAACTSLLGDDFTIGEGGAPGVGGSTNVGTSGGGTGGAPSHCTNGVRDGGETDIDCGGPCVEKCGLDEGCMLASDCASGHCGDEGLCVPPPPCGGRCEAWQTCEADVCTPGGIVYIHLDGGAFSYGSDDDASLSIQSVSNEALPGSFDPYGGTEFDKSALFDAIVANFEPFNIEITRVRPSPGVPYQMVVVTPTGSPFVPTQKIWAPPPDCGDQDDDNVAFVIYSSQSAAQEGISPYTQASVVSQAIGIIVGLEPVNGPTDIMHHTIVAGAERTFEDFCHPPPTSITWICNSEHMAGCNGNPNLQSSHAELMGLFGAAP